MSSKQKKAATSSEEEEDLEGVEELFGKPEKSGMKKN